MDKEEIKKLSAVKYNGQEKGKNKRCICTGMQGVHMHDSKQMHKIYLIIKRYLWMTYVQNIFTHLALPFSPCFLCLFVL